MLHHLVNMHYHHVVMLLCTEWKRYVLLWHMLLFSCSHCLETGRNDKCRLVLKKGFQVEKICWWSDIGIPFIILFPQIYELRMKCCRYFIDSNDEMKLYFINSVFIIIEKCCNFKFYFFFVTKKCSQIKHLQTHFLTFKPQQTS